MKKSKQPARLHHKVIRRARDTTIPHKGNRYNPHLVRTRVIVVLLAFVGIATSLQLVERPEVLGESTAITRQALLETTNQERSKSGQAALRENDKLNTAAALKAGDMLKEQYWAHVSPSGVQPWKWFEISGYEYSVAGENLARGFYAPEGITAAWMQSKEHRENILNPNYTDVGFAAVSGELEGKQTTVVVAMYGSESQDVASSNGEVLAATGSSVSLIEQFGIGLKSLSPTALASVLLLLFVAVIALATHANRAKFPKQFTRGLARHHALAKAGLTASVAVIVIALYGVGQI